MVPKKIINNIPPGALMSDSRDREIADPSDIINFVPARSLIKLVTDTISLMNRNTATHQKQVGYLSYQIAREMKLPVAATYLTMEAGMLHDIGGSVRGRDVTVEEIEADQEGVAKAGAELLNDFPMLRPAGEIIRYSQRPYSRIEAEGDTGFTRVVSPQIVHIADAFALLMDPDRPPLNQVSGILAALEPYVGSEFSPQAFQALKNLKGRDKIWFDLFFEPENLASEVIDDRYASLKTTLGMTHFVSTLIDFRSPFTAMHSAGVAASAKALAGFVGMSKQECCKIEIAGNLHDLGKLRTPKSILEKPGKLTPEEFNVIKEHAFFTYETLKWIPGMDDIAKWAGFHHEKLNGRGYPYGLKEEEIPLGAKIMAVADIFSAITEDRPYRSGMPKEKILMILAENAASGALSPELVEIMKNHYDEINQARRVASEKAGARYFASFPDKEDKEDVR